MYTPQDYLLFFLAIVLFLGGLALLGTSIEWRENRKAKRRERQLHNLNRREDFRRRHASYLAQMQEMLESVEGRKGA
ncbi:MAG: hypothetical protein HFE92_01265 [Acutalibacter muris]|nr:hypothetical protein [Acutalibacter muris]